MKNSRSVLFVFALLLVTSLSFANTNESTPISGTYDGNLETQTLLQSRGEARTSVSEELNIQFLFNGNVFIYQGKKSKAMGNYELVGNKIVFTVTSVKGDSEAVYEIFDQEYTYSRSGDKLMLIGKSDENSDIYVYTLTKAVE